EIVLWPLGGMTPPELPRRPGAHAFAAIGGPLVNLGLAAVAGGALVGMGYYPPWNPLASPLNPQLRSWKEGITYFSAANPGEAELWFYNSDPKTKKQVEITFETKKDGKKELKESSPGVAFDAGKNEWYLQDNPGTPGE